MRNDYFERLTSVGADGPLRVRLESSSIAVLPVEAVVGYGHTRTATQKQEVVVETTETRRNLLTALLRL